MKNYLFFKSFITNKLNIKLIFGLLILRNVLLGLQILLKSVFAITNFMKSENGSNCFATDLLSPKRNVFKYNSLYFKVSHSDFILTFFKAQSYSLFIVHFSILCENWYHLMISVLLYTDPCISISALGDIARVS